MKKSLLVMLIVSLICCSLFAADTKWEYMVVSFGSTSFSQFYSKTMAYWDEGIDVTAMGGSLETALDILGQHGWEVISIVGTIGGDQQVTLKREYDAKRTTNELTEIQKNSALMVDSYEKILAEAAAATKKTETTVELIDLDAKEAEEQKLATRKKMEDAITGFLNGMSYKPYDISFLWTESSRDESVSVYAYYDMTSDYLIKGTNTYRRKSVISFLSDLGSKCSDIPWRAYISYFNLMGTITYSGKKFDVGTVAYYVDYKKNWSILSTY